MNGNNALIPLIEGEMQGRGQHLCNARDLHAFLEVKWEFAKWIIQRIAKYGFVEGVDFIVVDWDSRKTAKQVEYGGDRRSVEYHLTLDMAKQLAMVQNNEHGRQARLWFIECERIAFGSRDGLAIDTGPIGFYLPPGVEDHVVHADGLVESDSRAALVTCRALMLGAKRDLLDIQQNRKEMPRCVRQITPPTWIRLNNRHAMFGHVAKSREDVGISPWLFGSPFAADSIMFMRNEYYSMDFASLLEEQGYSARCLIGNFR